MEGCQSLWFQGSSWHHSCWAEWRSQPPWCPSGWSPHWCRYRASPDDCSHPSCSTQQFLTSHSRLQLEIQWWFNDAWPVTDHRPSGEPGLAADEGGVVGISASEHRVSANITLSLACGEVPVRNCKVLIASQSLKGRQYLFNCLMWNKDFSWLHLIAGFDLKELF